MAQATQNRKQIRRQVRVTFTRRELMHLYQRARAEAFDTLGAPELISAMDKLKLAYETLWKS